jgi:hypothetical protein
VNQQNLWLQVKRKVEFLKTPLYIGDVQRTYGLNMTISTFLSSKYHELWGFVSKKSFFWSPSG